MKKALVIGAALAATTLGATAQQVMKADSAIPAYQKASGVSGNISTSVRTR